MKVLEFMMFEVLTAGNIKIMLRLTCFLEFVRHLMFRRKCKISGNGSVPVLR
jgi:hypothetical protein